MATNLTHDIAPSVGAVCSRPVARPTSQPLGDSFLLDRTFESTPASEIAKQFGKEFAVKLVASHPGQWQGPIESGYGMHLVLVSKRTEGNAPPAR